MSKHYDFFDLIVDSSTGRTWGWGPAYQKPNNKEILEKIDIKEIEQFLRQKKLENINKNNQI